MSANSKIEWTDATINWWWGCTEVSEECRYCYARTLDKMRGPLFDHGRVHWGPRAPRWVKTDSATQEAIALNRKAALSGKRLRVFVNSMSDTFEDHEQLPAAREILFNEIQSLANLDFQLLTKRPENIAKMVPPHWMERWPEHVWIGTTTGLQETANQRIPHLLKIPAKVRFLSCEPLLEPVHLGFTNGLVHGYDAADYRVDWVICGGESGPNARAMRLSWARSLRDQCQEAEVPFLFKQWGEWMNEVRPGTEVELATLKPNQAVAVGDGSTNHTLYTKVGKHVSGRLLDGREWNEFPESSIPHSTPLPS
jgi:protein gp37